MRQGQGQQTLARHNSGGGNQRSSWFGGGGGGGGQRFSFFGNQGNSHGGDEELADGAALPHHGGTPEYSEGDNVDVSAGGEWFEGEVYEVDGRTGTITCTVQDDGVRYVEIEDSDIVTKIRPMGRRAARGTVTAAQQRERGRIYYPEPEPEPEVDECVAAWVDQHCSRPSPVPRELSRSGQRDSLAGAMARVTQEGPEFQEAAFSYLASTVSTTPDRQQGVFYEPLTPTSVAVDTPSRQPQRARAERGGQKQERPPSMTDPLVEVAFTVGEEVWIYSTSASKWVVGEVQAVIERQRPASSRPLSRSGTSARSDRETVVLVQVSYWAGNAKRAKDVEARDRRLIRPLHAGQPNGPAE